MSDVRCTQATKTTEVFDTSDVERKLGDKSNGDTSLKKSYYLSLSVLILCAVCETDIIAKYKRPEEGRYRLFKEGKLTEAGKLIEKALGVHLCLGVDLPFRCKN